MNIQVIRTKAGRAKELSRESIELKSKPLTLDQLLIALTEIGLQRAQEIKRETPLDAEAQQAQAATGRISFGARYGSDSNSLETALGVMRQDFNDGLFRVFIDQEEASSLDAPIVLEEGAEISLLKLVMLTGRLW